MAQLLSAGEVGTSVAERPMTTAADLDQESRAWLESLGAGPGPERDLAVRRLHDLLLRAARFELHRRRAGYEEDLAFQAADDAVVAILAKLETYRGASR